jgi:hypothetical protein
MRRHETKIIMRLSIKGSRRYLERRSQFITPAVDEAFFEVVACTWTLAE